VFAGLTYKKNVSDIRNSHSLKIFQHFSKLYKKIYFIDPFIHLHNIKNKQIIMRDVFKDKDIKCIVLLVDHDSFKSIIKKVNNKISLINIFNFYEK
jgi:UDP-N-acetyl-D-mannosaminuronate dehydrogenase